MSLLPAYKNFVPECSCMLLVHMLLHESCQQAVQNLGKEGGKGEVGKKEEGRMRGEVARRRIKYGREGKPEGWGRERSGKVHKKTNVVLHCLGVMLA